ncbi:hypothetical protein ACFQ1I_35995 [Kitasatospora arboriphila]
MAVALWVLALRGARLDRMGDLGLLQALPMTYWAGFAVLLAGFVAVLYQPRVPQGWAAAYVVALITMIHATPSVLYPTLRYAWAWKHIAVVDAMLRHNGTVPNAADWSSTTSGPASSSSTCCSCAPPGCTPRSATPPGTRCWPT